MRRILLCFALLVFLCGCGKTAEITSVSPTVAPADAGTEAVTDTDTAATPAPVEEDIVLPELTLTEATDSDSETPEETEAPVENDIPAAVEAPAVTAAPAENETPAETEAPAEPFSDVPWDTTGDGIELPMDPL